ncbi:MAG: GNAT family N-acetyltransferase [Ectobacillus sp.]
MALTLHPLTEKIAHELLQFELDNRAFFESMIPSRGDNYYSFPVFLGILQGLIKKYEKGTAFMYIIRNEAGEIIGRINLVNIKKDTKTAELGYRIGEAFGSKGFATEAVRLVLQEAKKHGLHYVQASTIDMNEASQAVLVKNHFQLVSRECGRIQLDDKTYDVLTFQYDCTKELQPLKAEACPNGK